MGGRARAPRPDAQPSSTTRNTGSFARLRTRWGSCAPDGTLAFCWRLICAPEFVQDYVVGHEVAHLRHMNHGAQFWALTEELTTHRKAASAWLGSNGQALLRIG